MSKKILVTGASSGLGEGMARHLARRGHRLALVARRRDRLDRLATELRSSGAPAVVVGELDVTAYATIPDVMGRMADELGGLDVVIVNAGTAGTTVIGKGHFAEARRIIDTNLTGAIATIEAAIERFRKQGHGHLVAISSVAGARGTKGQGAYSASKAGLNRYLESLRVETVGENIQVTDLAPGFIDTDLNRHVKNRPFVVTAEKGTAALVDAIEKQVGFRYVPFWPWTLMAQLLKILPAKVVARI
jgi:short-subunit dehydrogenase